MALDSRPTGLTLRLSAATVALLISLAGAAADATAGGAGQSARPRTLLAISGRIQTFSQDGGRIAWIGRPSHGRCGLHVRTLQGGRTATTRLKRADCQGYWGASHLALANRAAAWAEGYSCGNNECFWKVAAATAGDPGTQVVAAEDLNCDPDSCESGQPAPRPFLAGSGGLLVYSNSRVGVERIRGGGGRRLFRTSGEVYGFASSAGLIATASLSLQEGDGCGCLDLPVWSPDGTKIAFLDGVLWRNSVPSAAVAVMNADGSGRHTITMANAEGGSLSWSPDGTKIAYDALVLGEKIEVANADGSGAVQLGVGTDPAWSPDGAEIAFVRSDNNTNTSGVFVMKPDGTDVRQLATFSSPAGTSSPPVVAGLAWSRDGGRIAFALHGTLELMNADGSDVHELGNAIAGGEPTWSPDGSEIAFADSAGLAVVATDGSGERQLTSGPDYNPSWSPDGKTIAFSSDRDDAYANGGIYNDQAYLELYVVDPGGGNPRPFSFTQPAAWENALAVHSGGGKPLALATLPGRAFPGLALAGKVAAVGETLGGVDQIVLFDAHTGAQLATVQLAAGQHSFALLGGEAGWVVYSLGRTISAVNVHSHNVVRLGSAGTDPIGLSVSGRRVAWAENVKGHGRVLSLELPG